MNPQRVLSGLRHGTPISLGAVLLVSYATACAVGIVLSKAQSPPQEEAAPSASQERKLKMRFHPRLPIKVKVKNLQSEKWARDFEVEVTNTSNKPIYFLSLGVVLPEVSSPDGYEIVFPLRYGRMDFISFQEPVRDSDVPIQPGEKYVFKIVEQEAEVWEKYASKRNLLPLEPRKVQIIFQSLNFGDGTGFHGTTAEPVPNKPTSKTSDRGRCEGQIRTDVATFELTPFAGLFLPRDSPNFLPANFQPVKHFEVDTANSILSKSLSSKATATIGPTAYRLSILIPAQRKYVTTG